MNEFDKLLAEIGDLHKALPADGDDTAAGDGKIAAAAADGDKDADKDKDSAKDKDKDADKDGDKTMKSFTVTAADGTETVAYDATDLVKALGDRLETVETVYKSAFEQLLDIVKSQGAQIKKLSEAGKGRKAVVTVAEKPAAGADVSKSDPAGLTSGEFLAKSMQCFTKGTLTGHQVRLAEAAINQGKPIPRDIVNVVMAS